jgi:glycosyltransferase involved in cell wall biosynthesis
VHLVSFVRSAAEDANARALSHLCSGITTLPLRRSRLRDGAFLLRSLVTRRPFLIERDDSAAMRSAIDELLLRERFDAVHADQLSMAQFAVDLKLPLRVLDDHNAVWSIVQRAAMHEGWGIRRILAELEWRKLRRYEVSMCQQFDLVSFVSTEDYLAMIEAGRAHFPAKVIPIAVDTLETAFVPRTENANQILSVATMFYPPNVEGVHWFATQVFPLIRREINDVQFQVVGSRPPKKITRLAESGSGIVVTGYVPDLSLLLQRAAVLVVPLRSGSGMRVKILESFARGIPVVSTSIGVEGIQAEAGEHLLVADDPEGFSQAVIRALRDRAEAARLARSGRQLVERSYDWHEALSGLDEIYQTQGERASLDISPEAVSGTGRV